MELKYTNIEVKVVIGMQNYSSKAATVSATFENNDKVTNEDAAKAITELKDLIVNALNNKPYTPPTDGATKKDLSQQEAVTKVTTTTQAPVKKEKLGTPADTKTVAVEKKATPKKSEAKEEVKTPVVEEAQAPKEEAKAPETKGEEEEFRDDYYDLNIEL